MTPIWARSRRRLRAFGVVSLLLLGIGGSAFAVEQLRSSCPFDWRSASTRIELSGPSGDVMLGDRPYRVGGGALLDYMPRALISPFDRLTYGLRSPGHPLGVSASISASSREALGEPVFTCVRVTHGSDVWARRPTTYETQTMADGYPPGAPPPAVNEAWRGAYATDGPRMAGR
jgi:hypothetical protein